MRPLLLIPALLGLLLVTSARSCRMLAVISEPGTTLDMRDANGQLNPILQAEIDEFQLQGGSGSWPYSNRDGWGMTSYHGSENLREAVTIRSALPAFEDSLFTESIHSLLAAEGTTLLLGHLRQVSSGATGIENPHPFLFTSADGTVYTFAHNGDLNKDDLRQLIGDAWLTMHPPQTYGNGPWNGSGWDAVVDSELFLFWIMVNTETAGSLQEGLLSALNILETDLQGQIKNFILSDGSDLYAYRSSAARDIYYFDGNFMEEPPWYLEVSGHRAVMSTPPTTGPAAGFPWTALENHHLLVLTADGSSMTFSIPSEGYTAIQTASSKLPGPPEAHPNPFNHCINITVPASGPVRLRIFNLLGELVYGTENQYAASGKIHFNWPGTDYNGVPCTSGMYVYVLQGSDWRLSRKILLLK